MKSSVYLSELQNKSVEQLMVEKNAAKKELFELRLKAATNQLTNTSKINTVRKNIARIETIITMKNKNKV